MHYSALFMLRGKAVKRVKNGVWTTFGQVSDRDLQKPGLLTPEEFAAMKEKLFGLYDSGFEPLCF